MVRLLSLTEVRLELDAYAAEGIRVLGAEGFRVEDNARIPEMDAILDLSSVEDHAVSVQQARRFFRSADAQLVWELVSDRTT